MLASKVDIPDLTQETSHLPLSGEVWDHLVQPYQAFLQDVDKALKAQVNDFEPEVQEHASYAISNPGKRLRPLLVALAGGAEQDYDESLINVAVIIEMVHLATLVHDDILDAADMRRNRPTLASQVGTDVTVLLGDCLFAHALELAATYPATDVCRAVSQATKRVCSGEILQSLKPSDKLTREQYLRVIEMKTAELFGLSCQLGARYGNPFRQHDARIRSYGMALGTAYQIYDDCLDIFGTEKATGKSLGTDLVKEKQTLPILILLENSEPDEKNQIISKLNRWDRCHTPWLMTLMTRHQVLEKSERAIRAVLDDSRACLDPLEPSPSVTALYKLSEFLELKVGEMALRMTSGKHAD